MKIIGKTIILLFLTIVMLASCNGSAPVFQTQPTQVMETALAFVKTAIAETQTAFPTATSTATLIPSATPLPTFSPLPPTETPIPTSALLFSGIPTVIPMDNGLTWSECVVPYADYDVSDLEIPRSCFDTPAWNENDLKRVGERVSTKDGDIELRITIGTDHFEAKPDHSEKLWTYKLIKNEEVILKVNPSFYATNPNKNFWNIGEKLVWELAGGTAIIVVDGVNYNEKYQLEGAFHPYEIKGKLIFIAKKNEKYHIVYDDKVMGPEFDELQLFPVYHGSGQYWFLGRRGGTKYVVSIQ